MTTAVAIKEEGVCAKLFSSIQQLSAWEQSPVADTCCDKDSGRSEF